MKRLATALVCGTFAFHANARRIEPVAFPSIDADASGAAVLLEGMLLLPREAAPRGGYPAIVALHGCGGMYSTREGHEDELAERMASRVEPLLQDGYAVLFVDSFRARGVREVCTVKVGERTVTVAKRRLDALGALTYLASRKDIARARIALVGWSHGGSTALQVADVADRAVAAFSSRAGAPPFFRAIVAFYPGCRTPLKAAASYRPGAPTRIHIGALDDWTPASTCVAFGDAMAARNEDVLVTTYAGSYHAFDSPSGTIVHRTDVPNGVHRGEGVHVGPNPQARDAANASVRAFLRERLQ
jgi:Dienelactone hydrolase and related enzymes